LEGMTNPTKQDGVSMVPLLKNPKARWNRPVLTTYGFRNHAIRTGGVNEGWRYIRYNDGGEELYDRAGDPNEGTNLAGKPEFAKKQAELKAMLPQLEAAEAPRVKPDASDV